MLPEITSRHRFACCTSCTAGTSVLQTGHGACVELDAVVEAASVVRS